MTYDPYLRGLFRTGLTYDPYMDFRAGDIGPYDPYMDFGPENIGPYDKKKLLLTKKTYTSIKHVSRIVKHTNSYDEFASREN